MELRLLGRRQFGTCFLIMLITGGIIVSTVQLIPELADFVVKVPLIAAPNSDSVS